MSPLGCQKISAKPCNRNAEERFPVLSLKSREQKPPNPLLIQDKNVLQPSDEPTGVATLQEDGWRFDSEENFLDDKSHGFQLASSLIRSAQALERWCGVWARTTLSLRSEERRVG